MLEVAATLLIVVWYKNGKGIEAMGKVVVFSGLCRVMEVGLSLLVTILFLWYSTRRLLERDEYTEHGTAERVDFGGDIWLHSRRLCI